MRSSSALSSGGETGAGLVHQDDLRPADEGPGDLDPAPVEVGEAAPGTVPLPGQADEVEQLIEPSVLLPAQRSGGGVGADQHVVPAAELGQDLARLEGAAHTEPGSPWAGRLLSSTPSRRTVPRATTVPAGACSKVVMPAPLGR